MTFWLRRCTEQSRSPSATTRPWPSPKICTSMWRAMLDVFLQEDAALAEVAARQALDRMEGFAQFVGAPAQLHADAAAAGGALEHHRVADARGLAQRVGDVVEQAAAGQQRHAVAFGQLARGVLEAEVAHLLRRRADEGDAGRLAGLGEGGVLAEEAVAGMDGAGAGLARRVQDTVLAQIAFRGRRRAETHRLVGLDHMARVRGRPRSKPPPNGCPCAAAYG